MGPIERLILVILIHYNAYWKYLLKQLARRDWKQSFSGTHRLKINKNARYQCRFEPIFQTRKSCLNYFNVLLHVNIIFQKCVSLIFLESVGNALQVFFPVTIIKLILTIKVIKLLSEGVCISCPCRLTLATDVFPSHCLLVHLSETIMRSFRNGFHCFEKSFWEE